MREIEYVLKVCGVDRVGGVGGVDKIDVVLFEICLARIFAL